MFRYPGGKYRLYKKIKPYLINSYTYIEPFFGSGFIGLKHLENNGAKKYIFNDKNYAIYSVWKSVQHNPKKLKMYLKQLKPSVKNFYKIKELLENNIKYNIVKTAAIKIAIHQWSYSGLGEMAGGPIGGKNQKSKYKIDCRWNIELLFSKIDKFHKLFKNNNVTIYNIDAIELINAHKHDPTNFLYLDPPYYTQGDNLYIEKFINHKHMANLFENMKANCLISYDNNQYIRKIYKEKNIKEIPTQYSINGHVKKKEFLICNFYQNK